MGHPEDSTCVPLMEGHSTTSLANYLQSQHRRRLLRDVTLVVSCLAIFAWCGYLTLSVRDGVNNMKIAKMEIINIEDVVSDVVAAMPSDKNEEVITASVHIREHGVSYQQTVSYDPWTKIGRVHNPHHLDLDDTITLLHKPSGMMLMLNNNHKHCEYSAMPEGMDPEMFAQVSKTVEEEHTTLSMDLADAGDTFMGTVLGDTLSDPERETLQPEMQTLCAGLDIFHIRKVTLSSASANETIMEIPTEGGRVKRTAGFTCAGGILDKCYRYAPGWGRSCMWMICNRNMVQTQACAKLYNHIASQRLSCALCCKDEPNESLCKCNEIHEATSFTRCQQKFDNLLRQ